MKKFEGEPKIGIKKEEEREERKQDLTGFLGNL